MANEPSDKLDLVSRLRALYQPDPLQSGREVRRTPTALELEAAAELERVYADCCTLHARTRTHHNHWCPRSAERQRIEDLELEAALHKNAASQLGDMVRDSLPSHAPHIDEERFNALVLVSKAITHPCQQPLSDGGWHVSVRGSWGRCGIFGADLEQLADRVLAKMKEHPNDVTSDTSDRIASRGGESERIDKLTWQVRDTCTRAERAEGALRLAQAVLRRWTDLYAKLQNESGERVSRVLGYNLPPADHVRALEAIEEHFKAGPESTVSARPLGEEKP